MVTSGDVARGVLVQMMVVECDGLLSVCSVLLCCFSLVFLHASVSVVSWLFSVLGMKCR